VVALDIWIPMPLSWTIGEATSLFGWTAALWWLLRRAGKSQISNNKSQTNSNSQDPTLTPRRS
jgi:hypothetical protein